ncbi:MAG: glycosyltransferase [Candidatus Aenigmatarchaeota archaeon]
MISILIPTKNEPLIQNLVNEINKTIKQKHEIIIIDKSRRNPKIRGAKVLRQKSDGLGNAFLEGFAKSKGNIIAVMDGDGSHDPDDLKKMLAKIPEYDIAIGSKLVVGGRTEDSFSRRIVTRVTNSIARTILGLNIRDLMTGFIVVKRSVLEKIKLRPKGYKFVLEIIYKSKAKVVEVPITFHKREAGESKVGFNLKGIKEFSRIIILIFELRLGVNK